MDKIGKRKKRILVTGGAGFIGSHVCDALHGLGNEVWCVDNLHLGRLRNIQHLLLSPSFRFENIDVLDIRRLRGLFKKIPFDQVYHLAANSDIQCGSIDRRLDMRLTFQTTVAVLEAMVQHNARELFFASTSAVFGETLDRLHENYGPLRPISFYGASKLAAEAFISVYANHYGFKAAILRFPNVVGSRLTHGAIYDFVKHLKRDPHQLRVLGNGAQRKPYLHVDDLIDAILLIMRDLKDRFAVYHAGNEDCITVSEIVKVVLGEMHLRKCKIQYTGGDRGWVGDVPSFDYDISKIKTLGWSPKLRSLEAVRRAVQQVLSGNTD